MFALSKSYEKGLKILIFLGDICVAYMVPLSAFFLALLE